MVQKINHRELGWAIRELIDDNLTALDRHLLITIYLCLDRKFQCKGWSHKALAKVMALSDRAIKKSTSKLIKLQYLILIKKGSNLTHESNVYMLCFNKIMSKTTHKLFQKKGRFESRASEYGSLGLVNKTTEASEYGSPLASVKEAIVVEDAFLGGASTLEVNSKNEVRTRIERLRNRIEKEKTSCKT